MYADKVTDSMKRAMNEMERRRKIQIKFNKENGVTPTTIIKEIRDGIEKWKKAEEFTHQVVGESDEDYRNKSYAASLKQKMEQASAALEFDKAAYYRDKIREFEKEHGAGESVLGNFQPSAPMVPQPRKGRKRRG
jgi:excinuclease ABC subunit B